MPDDELGPNLQRPIADMPPDPFGEVYIVPIGLACYLVLAGFLGYAIGRILFGKDRHVGR